MRDDEKTDPVGMKLTHNELMSRMVSTLDYLVGRVDAIEAMLASAPPWAQKLIDRQNAQDKFCKEHHSNGNSKKPNSLW
jgi:hypothetical protein